jgi:hypothetical protein
MPNGLTRKRKQPGELREVLAQNVNRMMESRYRESSNRPMALAKEAGIALSSVQRTLSRETGATVDTLEVLAKVFGVQPFHLLVPWGLFGELQVPQAVERSRTSTAVGRKRKIR